MRGWRTTEEGITRPSGEVKKCIYRGGAIWAGFCGMSRSFLDRKVGNGLTPGSEGEARGREERCISALGRDSVRLGQVVDRQDDARWWGTWCAMPRKLDSILRAGSSQQRHWSLKTAWPKLLLQKVGLGSVGLGLCWMKGDAGPSLRSWL